MTIQIDHLLVPSRDRFAAAEQLAQLLGVPWDRQAAVGPFSAVYVSDALTLDFDQWEEDFPSLHCCFRVSESEFDAILARIRAKKLEYRSGPHTEVDFQIGTHGGGRGVYWSQPDGHVWEMLTVSYARRHGQITS